MNCTAWLNATSGSAQKVIVSADNAAVNVPASVTIPAHSTSAAFAVNVAVVASAQTATITGSYGGLSRTFTLRLGAGTSGSSSAAAADIPGIPVMVSPAPGSVLPGENAAFTWSVGSGYSQFQLWIGAIGVGSGDIGIFAASAGTGGTVSVGVGGIPMVGAPVYARLYYSSGDGNWHAVDYTYTESSGTTALNPSVSVSSLSVGFGNVALQTSATQSVTLTSTGASAVTVGAVTVTGASFSVSGVSLPLVLSPGQTATLEIAFNPSSAGQASGTVVLSSNAVSGSSTTIHLTGTGVAAAYEVLLTWSAPAPYSDPNALAGYRIYRTPSGSTNFQLLDGQLDASTTYADSTVSNGNSYSYVVTTVDNAGSESGPSNLFTIAIPSQ